MIHPHHVNTLPPEHQSDQPPRRNTEAPFLYSLNKCNTYINMKHEHILIAVLDNIVQADHTSRMGRYRLVQVTHCVPPLCLLVEHQGLIQGVHVRSEPA